MGKHSTMDVTVRVDPKNKSTTPISRQFVKGPHSGIKVDVPENVDKVDIGWWTAFYYLREDGRFHWESMADPKPVVPLVQPPEKGIILLS